MGIFILFDVSLDDNLKLNWNANYNVICIQLKFNYKLRCSFNIVHIKECSSVLIECVLSDERTVVEQLNGCRKIDSIRKRSQKLMLSCSIQFNQTLDLEGVHTKILHRMRFTHNLDVTCEGEPMVIIFWTSSLAWLIFSRAIVNSWAI